MFKRSYPKTGREGQGLQKERQERKRGDSEENGRADANSQEFGGGECKEG